MKYKTDINRFLELACNIPVVDVRSPSEFNAGHIPGAYNIPLFDDSQREAVGINYRKNGRVRSIMKGLELMGPSMHIKLNEALKLAQNRRLLVHCWRGGMRSEAMAWLFSLGDIETEILEGGYKSFRHHILESLSSARKMIVLGGLTGSGKTRILRNLKANNLQVADLEGIANHKGSAFGSLGQTSQPSTEQFANLLYYELRSIDADQPLWLEDESRNIGSIFLPENFYLNMQTSPAVILMMDREVRLPGLIREYAGYPPAELIGSISRISRRLGGDNAAEAILAVERGDFSKAVEITLSYYDKAYLYSLKKRRGKEIVYIETGTDNVEINSLKVLEAAKSIVW